ncbi:MAG: YceD family protein [Desulfomonilaceae bacterium]
MKIALDDITSSGLQISFDETEDVLSAAIKMMHVPTGTSIAPYISGGVFLEGQAGLFLIDGRITAQVTQCCSRCLKSFVTSHVIQLHFSARRISPELIASDVAAALDAQPDELVLLEDKLDLGELIAQEIMLDLPLQPLCRDDCPGLCPRCGGLKGSDECRCGEEKTIDPRWQKLLAMRGK